MNNKNQKNMRIRRIDNHNRFALNFFWENGEKFFNVIKYNVGNSKVETIRVGFVGFGEYAYELLKVLCCLGQLPRCRLIVYIFDKNAKDRKERMQKELLDHRVNRNEVVASWLNSLNNSKERNLKESDIDKRTNMYYHDYPYYEIHFVDCDVDKSEFLDNCFIKRKDKKINGQDGDEIIEHFTHMFFMLGSDKANINVATRVSIAYQRNTEKNNESNIAPQFYVMVKNDDTTAQLKAEDNLFKKAYPNIILIGSNNKMYSLDTIEEEKLEELGKQVHKLYSFNKELYPFIKDNQNNFEDKGDGSEESKIAEKAVINYLKDDYKVHSSISIANEKYEKILNEIIKTETLDSYIKKNNKYHKINSEIEELESKLKILGDRDRLIVKKQRKLKYKLENLKNELEKEIEPYINRVLAPIKWLYNSERLEEDYNEREYYRRSSKSRVLFEKMLFDLGYLYFDKTTNKIQPNNVVSEFGVIEDAWRLPNIKDRNDSENYLLKNIPTYKTRKNSMDSKETTKLYSDYDSVEVFKIYNSAEEKLINHINVQWFEVNNILQKRWMVFRWGEGYIPSDDKTSKEIDSTSKKHKFLWPYIYIYANDEMRIWHTIDITYEPNYR